MARNKYAGTCYRCGLPVAPYDGHFERYGRSWRVQHASCCLHAQEVRAAQNNEALAAYIERNLWDFDGWKVVTTNGIIGRHGEAIMGAGLALDAKIKFPQLPKQLAEALREGGNIPYAWPKYKIITFPTKEHYLNDSPIELIEQSARLLAEKMEKYPVLDRVGMPRAGCKNGRLDWTEVKPVLDKHLAAYIKTGRFVYINP